MTITVEDFRSKFPMFDCIDDGVVEMAIMEADCHVNDCAWGKCADLGRFYYTAHVLDTTYKGYTKCSPCGTESCGGSQVSPVGALKRLTLDEWSEFYHVPKILDKTTLGSTPWGVRFFEMKRLAFGCRMKPLNIGCAPCGGAPKVFSGGGCC